MICNFKPNSIITLIYLLHSKNIKYTFRENSYTIVFTIFDIYYSICNDICCEYDRTELIINLRCPDDIDLVQ